MSNIPNLGNAIDNFTHFVGNQSVSAQELEDELKDERDEDREAADALLERLWDAETSVRGLAVDLGSIKDPTVEGVRDLFDLNAVIGAMAEVADILKKLQDLDAWKDAQGVIETLELESQRFTGNGSYANYAKNIDRALNA